MQGWWLANTIHAELQMLYLDMYSLRFHDRMPMGRTPSQEEVSYPSSPYMPGRLLFPQCLVSLPPNERPPFAPLQVASMFAIMLEPDVMKKQGRSCSTDVEQDAADYDLANLKVYFEPSCHA